MTRRPAVAVFPTAPMGHTSSDSEKPVDSPPPPGRWVVSREGRNGPVESLKSLRSLVTGWVLLLKSAASRVSSGGALLGNDLA